MSDPLPNDPFDPVQCAMHGLLCVYFDPPSIRSERASRILSIASQAAGAPVPASGLSPSPQPLVRESLVRESLVRESLLAPTPAGIPSREHAFPRSDLRAQLRARLSILCLPRRSI